MNQKELNEIRRRMNPERTTVSKLWGCYVNTAKNIISDFECSMGLLTDLEREKYLAILRGALSGSLGRNLLAIPFSVQEEAGNEAHRLLYDLRRTSCADPELRKKFWQEIIDVFSIEDTNYLILLADDVYDVPKRSKNDDDAGSDSVFHYILCAVCPVKDGKPGLGYDPGDRQFHSAAPIQTVAPPVLGFLYPAFDGRAANIHAALYYSKDAGEIHGEFVDAVFGTTAPMSSEEQKDTFCEVLADTLDEACSFEVVQAVHGSLRERLLLHKESRDPEVCEITPDEVGDILADSGVEEAKVDAFRTKCTEKFGGDALVTGNLLTPSAFRLTTAEAKITVDPEAARQVETRIIDGRKYILIPADADVEINGMNVKVTG